MSAFQSFSSFFRRQNFITDTLAMINSRVINLILAIIASILVARVLGPEQKGVVTTILAVPALLFPLMESGLRQTTTYFLGKQKHDDQTLLSTLGLLSIIVPPIAFLFTLLLYLVYGYWSKYGVLVLAIGSFGIMSKLWAAYFKGILLGKRQIRSVALAEIVISISYLAGVLLLLLPLVDTIQVEYVLLITALSYLFSAIFLWKRTRQYGTLKPVYHRGLPTQFFKMGIVYAVALFVLNLNYRIDILLLEYYANAEQVGIYSIGVKIAELLWLFPAVIGYVNFSYSASSSDVAKHIKKSLLVMRVTFWSASIPILGLYLLTPILIPLAYGEAYRDSIQVVQAILPGVWAALVFKLLNSDLAGRGRPGIALGIFSFTAVLNVVLNMWWDPKYGALGSSWASTVSYICGAIFFAVAYARVSHTNLYEMFIPTKTDFRKALTSIRK